MAQAQVVITGVDRTQSAINSAMRGLKGLGDQAGLLKRAFAGIGAVAVTSFLTRTASAALQYGDELQKASVKSGIAASQLSGLAYAAKQSDIDLSSLSENLKKMQLALSQATTGGKSQKEALDALGISLQQIESLNPQEQFLLLARQISELKNPTDKARAAVELFGRSGANLLPLFEDGAEGIRSLIAESERLGTKLTDEQVQALAEADDAVKRLSQSYDAFATKLTGKVAPALTSLFDVLSGAKGVFSLFPGFEEKAAALGGGGGKSTVSQEALAKADAAFAAQKAASTAPGFKEDTSQKAAKAIQAALKRDEQIKKEIVEIIEKATSITEFENQIASDIEQGAIALRDSFATILEAGGEIGETIQDTMDEALGNKVTQMTEFARTAASNIQSAFANFLFDPFKDGLRGMLSGLVDILRRMVAEIAAQQLLLAFFGMFTGGTGFLASFSKAAVDQIKGKATGGPVSSGMPYIVGERGPELFVPGASGGIVPNNRLAMGGGVTVAPVYNIDARGATADLQAALPAILSENNRRIFDELDRRYGIGR